MNIPQDLMEREILARLPVKSLLRFKSVCKLWNSLITCDLKFIKTHSHTPKPSSFQSHLITSPTFGMEINPNMASYGTFMECCNGLICIAAPSLSKDVTLWNPATKSYKLLPPSNNDFKDVTSVFLGFGCNAEGDDFQVARIFFCRENDKRIAAFEVYSSASNSWTRIHVGLESTLTSLSFCGNAKGNAYWCAINNTAEDDTVEYFLLEFDATETAFKILPFPEEGEAAIQSLVDWEGSLGALVCVSKADGSLERIDVLTYNVGGRSWANKVSFGPFTFKVVGLRHRLSCSRSGKIVGLEADEISTFVIDTKTSNDDASVLRDVGGRSLWMLSYDESLACVEGMAHFDVTRNELEEEDIDGEFNKFEGFLVYSFNHWTGEAAYHNAVAV